MSIANPIPSRDPPSSGPGRAPDDAAAHARDGRPPRLLTTGDVAEIFRCSPDTVERLARSGELRAIRLTAGGHRRYDPADVQDLVKRRKREAAAPAPRLLAPPRRYGRKAAAGRSRLAGDNGQGEG